MMLLMRRRLLLLLLCLLQAWHGQMLIALPAALAIRTATGCCRLQVVGNVAAAAAAIVAGCRRQHVWIAAGSRYAGVAHLGRLADNCCSCCCCRCCCCSCRRGRPGQRVRQNAHKAQSHGGTGRLPGVEVRYLGEFIYGLQTEGQKIKLSK